jgi:predicted AlkP superfamily pyrophosphatase or phosphodiesterase
MVLLRIFLITIIILSTQNLFAEQVNYHNIPVAKNFTNLPINTSSSNKIKLVLIIVVDQLGAIHIETFGSSLGGGIKKLLNNGVVFTDAHHRHAITETCPGHATISTGTPPSIHGIVANEWVERDSGHKKYCVEDNEFGFSPRSLRVSGLADWIKHDHPQAQVVAVSGKDRSAILLASHNGNALWYDMGIGNFRSSQYYSSKLSIDQNIIIEEVKREQTKLIPYGTMWQLHKKTRKIVKKIPVTSSLKIGTSERKFPYLLGGISAKEDATFWSSIYHSPYLDALTAKAAGAILKTAKLGTKSYPDFLAVSFSSLDVIGHEFGPTSIEALDTLVRVSELIDDLLKNAINQVGRENLLVVLTSDHGALPLPENYEQSVNEKSQSLSSHITSHNLGKKLSQPLQFKRLTSAEIACIQKEGRLFKSKHKDIDLRPDFTVVAKDTQSNLAKLRRALASNLKNCASLRAVWTKDELMGKSVSRNLESVKNWQIMFSRSFYEPRSPDILLQFNPGILITTTPFGTGHGTPYDYDTKVPIVFYGGNLSTQQIATPVGTEQIAPTVANMIGLRSFARSDEVK